MRNSLCNLKMTCGLRCIGNRHTLPRVDQADSTGTIDILREWWTTWGFAAQRQKIFFWQLGKITFFEIRTKLDICLTNVMKSNNSHSNEWQYQKYCWSFLPYIIKMSLKSCLFHSFILWFILCATWQNCNYHLSSFFLN